MKQKKRTKKLIQITLLLFILMNMVAGFHAYKFTHFSADSQHKTSKPEELTITEKLKTLLTGVDNPRPIAKDTPSVPYNEIHLADEASTACWEIPAGTIADIKNTSGTVIICHGYGAEKSTMLDKAYIFDSLGYNTLLIDFMGGGGSSGNATTIGFKEAKQVKSAFEYLQKKGEKNILLFGTSMGAVAIMKAMNDYELGAKALILECPFGSMYQTVCARFKQMHAPCFPMADLLVFWGGTINGFWAFSHNPVTYAGNIHTPTLLLYGSRDKNVTREETDAIFTQLKGEKQLRIYPEAGHENYLIKYAPEWTEDVTEFLSRLTH